MLLEAHLVEKVMAYIDGTSPSFPVLDARNQLPRSMSAIYYLLADYYFKVNEWVSNWIWSDVFHNYLTQNSKRVSLHTFTLLLIKKSGDICDSYSLIAEDKSTWGRNKEKTVMWSTPAMKTWALKSLHMFRLLLLIVEFRNVGILCLLFNYLKNHTISGKYADGIKCVFHSSLQFLFRTSLYSNKYLMSYVWNVHKHVTFV